MYINNLQFNKEFFTNILSSSVNDKLPIKNKIFAAFKINNIICCKIMVSFNEKATSAETSVLFLFKKNNNVCRHNVFLNKKLIFAENNGSFTKKSYRQKIIVYLIKNYICSI